MSGQGWRLTEEERETVLSMTLGYGNPDKQVDAVLCDAQGRKALEYAARKCDANAADLTIEAESHDARGWILTGNELRKQAMQARDDAAAIREGAKS